MSVREPGVHAEFEMYPVLHGIESKAQGREIYVDKPHVRIKVAGNDKEEYFGPVNEQIRARFPEEWEAFERGGAEVHIGTPIDRWPEITPSQVKMLKALHIYTVEDMASLSDAGLQKVGMGGQKLRAAAQRFLSVAQNNADFEKMQELEAQNAAMKQQLAELQAAVAKLTKPAEDKPRRKAKETSE